MMIDYKNYLKISDKAHEHIEKNVNEYKTFTNSAEHCPKIIINVSRENPNTTPELLASPELMLKNALDVIQMHIDIGDDYIPQARIEFGTGQVAHAYGASMYIPMHSPACNEKPVLLKLEDIENIKTPSIFAGWMQKAYDFTDFYMENKPDIVRMQIPDYQGPWNNAHLVRGTDILCDFFDNPEHIHMIMQNITDYQIELTKHYRKIANIEDGYFADWGAYWKGGARLSSCSVDMISTAFYNDFVKPYYEKLYAEVGGGRVHYCGGHDSGVVDAFFETKGLTGLDLDSNYHDIWEIAKRAPKDVAVLMTLNEKDVERIMQGDIPNKRNMIFTVGAKDIEHARSLYKQLKNRFMA